MKGAIHVVKGRIEEAAGVLSGNKKLRHKGQTDQAVGQMKQAGEKGVKKARQAARKIMDTAKSVAQKGVDKAKASS